MIGWPFSGAPVVVHQERAISEPSAFALASTGQLAPPDLSDDRSFAVVEFGSKRRLIEEAQAARRAKMAEEIFEETRRAPLKNGDAD